MHSEYNTPGPVACCVTKADSFHLHIFWKQIPHLNTYKSKVNRKNIFLLFQDIQNQRITRCMHTSQKASFPLDGIWWNTSDHALNMVVFSAFFFLSIHKTAQRKSMDLTLTMEGTIHTALHWVTGTLFLFKFSCTLTTIRVLYSCGHSRSGTETLWRLFPISWDWNAELKKPSPGPLQKTAKNMTIQGLAKQHTNLCHALPSCFYRSKIIRPNWASEEGECSSLKRHTSLMLWITADRDTLAGNCPALQGLEVTCTCWHCTKHQNRLWGCSYNKYTDPLSGQI